MKTICFMSLLDLFKDVRFKFRKKWKCANCFRSLIKCEIKTRKSPGNVDDNKTLIRKLKKTFGTCERNSCGT
ncbi:hypothetical protein KUTeg_008730 [Tegillarca granosa]|uniref:Uncharacterized protein n=1 Tax=Tegillarca granosa TaxID=220873 RepID=A0ABQ9F9X9_TEGGR|nr:hypothetical protein KUTeg_008730 [Tegillarca granosa]